MVESVAFEIYRKSPEHVAGLREISSLWRSEPGGFWTFDHVIEALQRPAVKLFFVCAPGENRWQAAVLVDVGPYSADLLYVYVRPELRRSGIGRIAMNNLFTWLANNPGDQPGSAPKEELLLEVRLSNAPAIAMYESFGMTRVCVRKSYYADGEDGLVFKRKVKP